MTPTQTATKVRSVLRDAGPGNRVRLPWLASRLGVSITDLVAALPEVETPHFPVMPTHGASASIAMA